MEFSDTGEVNAEIGYFGVDGGGFADMVQALTRSSVD